MPTWSYLTFTQNFTMTQAGSLGANFLGITWSLAIEEQFYLILPFVIYFVPPRAVPTALMFFIVLSPLLRVFLFDLSVYKGLASYILMPCRADTLFLGVLCAYLVRQKKISELLSKSLRIFYWALVILFLSLFAMIINRQFMLSPGMTLYGHSMLALFYSCLLLITVLEKNGPVNWITSNPFLRKLGLIAYGVYIYHQGVSGLTHALLLNQTPQIKTWLDAQVTFAALCFTLGIAYLSWTYFERPITRIGHMLNYSK